MRISQAAVAILVLSANVEARSAEPAITIGGESEDAIRESIMLATGALLGGPDRARYLEVAVETGALRFFQADGKPIQADFCSLDEGEGGRRIAGIHQLSAEGQTAENIRYFLTFDLDAVEAAKPWTDLACHYRGSAFTLVLRGHFVAKDLGIVEGYDVLLTAVAP